MVTPSRRVLAAIIVCGVTAGCGPGGRDVFDVFNSRDTGPWLSLERAKAGDGTLIVHVLAHRPEHAQRIASHIVGQNNATAANRIRIIVDPASGDGERQVFRWDGRAITIDTDPAGLPPRHAGAASSHHE